MEKVLNLEGGVDSTRRQAVVIPSLHPDRSCCHVSSETFSLRNFRNCSTLGFCMPRIGWGRDVGFNLVRLNTRRCTSDQKRK